MLGVSRGSLRVAAVGFAHRSIPLSVCQKMYTGDKATRKWDNKRYAIVAKADQPQFNSRAPEALVRKNDLAVYNVDMSNVDDVLDSIKYDDVDQLAFVDHMDKVEVEIILELLMKKHETLASLVLSYRGTCHNTCTFSKDHMRLIQEKAEVLEQQRFPISYTFLNVPLNEKTLPLLCKTICDLCGKHDVSISTATAIMQVKV